MPLRCIVAMDDAGVIGRQGGLPWDHPTDLARFRNLTWGHAVVMGRRTYDGLRRSLPGRTLVVVTSRPFAPPAGVVVATGLQEALEAAVARDPAGSPWIAGGAAVYEATRDRWDAIALTRVAGRHDGDARFPGGVPGRDAWDWVWDGSAPGLTFWTLRRRDRGHVAPG